MGRVLPNLMEFLSVIPDRFLPRLDGGGWQSSGATDCGIRDAHRHSDLALLSQSALPLPRLT
jgi:hypothetical protein